MQCMMLPTKRETSLETGGVKEESSSGNVNVEAQAKTKPRDVLCWIGCPTTSSDGHSFLFLLLFQKVSEKRKENECSPRGR